MKKRPGLILVLSFLLGCTGCGESVERASESVVQSSQMEVSASVQSPEQESRASSESMQVEEPESTISTESTPVDEPGENKEKDIFLNVNKTSKNWSHSEMIENKYYAVEVQKEVFALDEESAARYPELDEALRSFYADAEEEAKENFDSLIDTFREMKSEGYYVTDLQDKTFGTVLRADEKVLSIREQNESFYGGAHGSYYVGGRAFEVQTGRQLGLSDVVRDGEQLKAIAAKQLDEQYGDIFYEDVYTSIDRYNLQDFNWEMDHSGVTLIFSQYELAPYVEGVQFVELSYEEYPKLLDGAYFNLPETYVQRIEDYALYWDDVDCDGETEEYQVEFGYNDEGDIQSVAIEVDGKEYREDIWAYDAELYFVKCRDAGYLYLFLRRDNDYVSLQIFDFINGEFRHETADGLNLCLPGSIASKELEDDNYYFEATGPEFLHPEQFQLSSNLNVLSTYMGTKTYHVGKDGIPVTDDSRYAADVYFLIKTKTDVPCKLVTPDGTVVEENSVIPAGTFFQIVSATESSVYGAKAIDYVISDDDDYLYRTDDNTKLQTDVLYLIQLDGVDSWTIGGVDIFELFDRLNFTG